MERDEREAFKACANCQASWTGRGDFLSDPLVRLLGFQPGLQGHMDGFLLFNHDACRTTLAVELALFDGLADVPTLSPAIHRLGQKNRFCIADLTGQPCPPYCSCEYVWKTMGQIEDWPKASPPKPR